MGRQYHGKGWRDVPGRWCPAISNYWASYEECEIECEGDCHYNKNCPKDGDHYQESVEYYEWLQKRDAEVSL